MFNRKLHFVRQKRLNTYSTTQIVEFDGMEKQVYYCRSPLLKRLSKLPPSIAMDVVDDVTEALKTRIETMERILDAKENS